MLPQLLITTLAIAIQAHSTAVLVTFSDSICNSTAGNALFSVAVNDQCQVMHNVEAFNIDVVAPGCSIWLYDDSICTTNLRLAPAVGVCIKQNTTESSLKVICSGANAGTGALAATSTASTSTASHRPSSNAASASSTSNAVSSSGSGSDSTDTSSGLSKRAQIVLAITLPLVLLALICVFGFRTWAKYRHGGYARPQTQEGAHRDTASTSSGTYLWEKNPRVATTAGVVDEDNAWGISSHNGRGELASREFDDPRELAGRRVAAEMA